MKKPNRFLAPIVIAGITVGFLASAYKFIIARPDTTQKLPKHQDDEHKNDHSSKEQK